LSPDVVDYRSHEVAGRKCSLSRAVDLDMLALSTKDKHMLEGEARLLGWIEGKLPNKPLERKTIVPIPHAERHKLQMLNEAGGTAFDRDDAQTRAVASFAFHYTLSQYDVWTNHSNIWRPWTGNDVNRPFNVAEEQQYGEFNYDTFLNVYELERYFYNWALRLYMWLEAGMSPDVNRWAVDESNSIMPHDTWLMSGSEPMPRKMIEKLQEPTDWIRGDVKGGARYWSWPLEWMSVGGIALSDMDVCHYAFSWHELLIRFEELDYVRRLCREFDERATSKLERSCANKLMHRVTRWRDRFGPWYTFARAKWFQEGEFETRYLYV
jgi:hypothetical protein